MAATFRRHHPVRLVTVFGDVYVAPVKTRRRSRLMRTNLKAEQNASRRLCVNASGTAAYFL